MKWTWSNLLWSQAGSESPLKCPLELEAPSPAHVAVRHLPATPDGCMQAPSW